jgi:capsular polysaccharide biosynthesis protein
MEAKSLHNTTANGARKNVKDIIFWGDGDTFRLISKASSEAEGWMKSTKAMPAGNSVVVQVTTQQRNPDGSYSIAEALTTVPNAIIAEFLDTDDVVKYRCIIERNDNHHAGMVTHIERNIEVV